MIKNYSVGIGHSAYASIDITGSVRGMKKAGYWKADDQTVRAHGYIFNLDAMRLSHPLDALSLWISRNKEVDLVEKRFELSLRPDNSPEIKFLD